MAQYFSVPIQANFSGKHYPAKYDDHAVYWHDHADTDTAVHADTADTADTATADHAGTANNAVNSSSDDADDTIQAVRRCSDSADCTGCAECEESERIEAAYRSGSEDISCEGDSAEVIRIGEHKCSENR